MHCTKNFSGLRIKHKLKTRNLKEKKMADAGRVESITAASIPTIDLQKFPKQLKKLIEACEDWGCFRVVNHKVSVKVMSEMKTVVRNLLDLPIEVKRRNVDSVDGSGYIEPSKMSTLYESLGIYDLANSDSVDAFCTQLQASQHQKETISAYTNAVQELMMDITTKLAGSLGVANDSFKDWLYLFRINKYNFMPENVGSPGLKLHTNGGFLTILQEDENVGDLEIMDKFGTFIPVEPLSGTFLVNVGDVGAAWSNGRFCNVKHRVQCKEASIRVSIVTQLLGPKDSNVEAPKELINNENPRLYCPFTYKDYRKMRNCTKLQAGEARELVRISS